MEFVWDPEKDRANQKKHDVCFEDAVRVFRLDDLALELLDEFHSDQEDRFITIGPIQGGLMLVVWTERVEDVSGSFLPAGRPRGSNASTASTWSNDVDDDMRELTEDDFKRTLKQGQRKRLMAGDIRSGQDIADLRRFIGLTQKQFAAALGISIRTLQGWEQGRRRPEGPSLALLRIAARHPRFIKENLASAA